MKKFVAILMFAVIFAQSFSTTLKADPIEEEFIEEEIPEEYTNISSISASLSINAGLATCYGRITMSNNHKSQLIVTLLRTTGSGYTTVAQWGKTFTGTGAKSLTKALSVTRGYTYRVKVQALIFNSSGDVIEAITKYSASVIYN